jgi:ubiquinone/menaquinone biosynthesis C-methylase UbiE
MGAHKTQADRDAVEYAFYAVPEADLAETMTAVAGVFPNVKHHIPLRSNRVFHSKRQVEQVFGRFPGGVNDWLPEPVRTPRPAIIEVTANGIGDHLTGLTVAAGWKAANPGRQLVYKVKPAARPWVSLFGGYDVLATHRIGRHQSAWRARNDHDRHFVEAAAAAPWRALPVVRPLPLDALAWAEPYQGSIVLAPFALGDDNREWRRFGELVPLIKNDFGVVTIGGPGDAGRLAGFPNPLAGESPARVAALMTVATAVIANESGMAHLAGALGVPCVVLAAQLDGELVHGFWPKTTVLQGPRSCSGCHWRGPHYDAAACRPVCPNLQEITPALVAETVRAIARRPKAVTPLSPLTATAFDRRYYDEHKAAGLDYLNHGDWQERYGRWLVRSLGLEGKYVLDVGCACGSIAEGFRKAGALVAGVDLNNDMIALGRERFSGLALAVCDAVNLHLVADASQDFYHAAQVPEHWRESLVPFILGEAYRVLRPGGRMLLVMDTPELFERQGRDPSKEDPTNGCVRPRAWWRALASEVGFEADPAGSASLAADPDSFLPLYDWDWLLVRRP